MADVTRREFLGVTLSAAVAGITVGFALENAELVEIVPFVEEGASPIGTLIEGSHQGRLVVDLAKLAERTLVTPNDEFFIRTRYPDGLHPEAPWTIQLRGHVRENKALLLDSLLGDVEPMGLQLLECSGNSKRRKFGLLSSAEWSGVPLPR